MLRTKRIAVLLFVAGCGPATGAPAGPRGDRLAPTTLYPMSEGAQWVYDVDTGGDEPPTLGIFEVVEVSGETRTIANNRGMGSDGRVRHAEPMIYRVARDGIRHVASGRWLLRAPIREGAQWESLGGRTARVTNVDAALEVVAGSYEHCVEVQESGGEDGRVIRTVYCPEVGPVLIESRFDSQISLRSVSTTARLRSYDPGGDEDL